MKKLLALIIICLLGVTVYGQDSKRGDLNVSGDLTVEGSYPQNKIDTIIYLYTVCPDNDTTDIPITIIEEEVIYLQYIAYRNVSGTITKQFGTFNIGYDVVADTTYYKSSYIGPEIGLGITANITVDSIQLNIIVDNSNTDDLSFGYSIIYRDSVLHGLVGAPTALATGTVTSTTYGISSDGSSDDVVLAEANTNQAGLLGADKWDEIVSNESRVEAVEGRADVYDTMLGDSLGWFNVVSYGADPTGVANSADNFRDAAYAASLVSGTVFAPVGTYYMTDSFYLYENVHYEFKNAEFTMPMDYTGSLMYSDANFINGSLDGGFYGGRDNEHDDYGNKWTCVKIVKSDGDTSYGMLSGFSNMFINRAKVGFDCSTTGTGWLNSNYVNNVTFWACNQAIKFRENGGQIAGWLFNNITIQDGPETEIGLDTIFGDMNQFTNIIFWDFNDTDDPATLVFGSGSTENSIIGANVINIKYRDLGDNNRVVTNGTEMPISMSLTNDTYGSIVIPFDSAMATGGRLDYTVIISNTDGDSIQSQAGNILYSAIKLTDGTFVSVIDAIGNDLSYARSPVGLTITEAWLLQDVVDAADYIRIRVKMTSNIGSATVPATLRFYYKFTPVSYHRIN